MVINPKYHNNGYGKLILNDLIKNNKKIINIDVDIFNATISITNISSIKLFESLNFTKKEMLMMVFKIIV
ncbi:MAG: GNAT family N-acetyltransferase [Bacilli bacterium]